MLRNDRCPGPWRAVGSVAVHETGHALVAAFSEHADPVAKVTILPRGAALGVTEQPPVSERHLYPQSYLTDSLTVRLGVRAAEVLVLGEPSRDHRSTLDQVIELLLDRETIDGRELLAITGVQKNPVPPDLVLLHRAVD